MATSMDDVARKAGVSKSTVSLVLNDKPGVSTQLAEIVVKAARDLNYKLPTQRPLRKQKSRQKNFTIVHQVGNEPYTNVYGLFTIYLQGIRVYAQQENINITAISGYRKEDFAHLAANILNDPNSPLDGLILMGVGVNRESRLVHLAIEKNIPLVVLSRSWPDLPISTVSQNHTHQAQIGLDYLEKLGHRKIAFLANKSDKEYEWFEIRLKCYRTKMKQLNHEVEEDLIALGENGTYTVKELLSRRPDVTAIYAIHDERAIQVIKGVMELGLEVPNDISVIGFNNSEESPGGYPKLTTVGVPHFDLGFLAAELLLKQINNDQLSSGSLTIQSKLIERESCSQNRGS